MPRSLTFAFTLSPALMTYGTSYAGDDDNQTSPVRSAARVRGLVCQAKSSGQRARQSVVHAPILRLAALILVVGVLSIVEAGGVDEQPLATALKNVNSTLEDGLKAVERTGRKPIFASFAVDRGVVHLSVTGYARDDTFSEVLLYPTIRMITETPEIADAAKLKIAAQQKLAMDRASVSLLTATENAVKANLGFRAVSVFPMLEEGDPVAVVTLLGNGAFKIVTEKLN